MASSFPKQSNSSRKHDIYETTKISINECLKQFCDFTNCINEVCNQASLIVRSLQSLEKVVIPEVVGTHQPPELNPSTKFHNSAYLMDSLDTFSKIMMSFSERIKGEAIDSFDNFIVQAILPNDDEIKGIQEHNGQIICEFREAFFSLYNHFLILAAELMEKFLICNNCSTPIGFPHQPLCLTKSMSLSNVWKKTKFDDKFITFGMNFHFDEIIIPSCRKHILSLIANACLKQCRSHGQEKTSMPLMTKNWPEYWQHSNRSKSGESVRLKPMMKARIAYHPAHSVLFEHSIWTPATNDSRLMMANNHYSSFTHPQDGFN